MIYPFQSLLRVNKAWLADSERVVKDRQPGAFKRLVNIVPNLSDGIGQLRTGYQVFNSTNGGINFNSDAVYSTTEIPFVHAVQSPTDYEVYLLCQKDGSANKRVAMYPEWYDSASTSPLGAMDGLLHIIETGNPAGPTDYGSFSYGGNKRTIYYDATEGAKADTAGLTNWDLDFYYQGWVVYNQTRGNYATVKTHITAGGGAWNFVFVEDVHNSGGASSGDLGWEVGDRLLWIKNFHENPYHATYFTSGFKPTYNDDKANPPTSNVQNSIIRFSGGQGSTDGLRGIHITPKLTRTFFPAFSDSNRRFTLNKTYAAERECKAPVLADILKSGEYVNLQDGRGDTEVVLPSGSGTILYPTKFSITGGSDYHTVIDDGVTPNDSDYFTQVYAPAPPYDNGIVIYMAPPEKAFDREGTTDFVLRYAINDGGSGKTQYLQMTVRDGSGAIFGSNNVSTVNSSGIQELTVSNVPNTLIDPTTWYVYIYMSIAPATVLSANIVFYNLYATADVLTDNILDVDKTYYVGISAVYDGFQISLPQKIETLTDYNNISGNWVDNYLSAGATTQGVMKVNFRIPLGKLNKRITGFNIYLAIDEGQTTARVAKYQFLKHISVTTSDGYGTSWTYDGTTGTFNLEVTIGGPDVLAIGNVFETDAGYSSISPDTGYAYSTEEVVSGRRMLANLYVRSNSFVDRSFIFTNPTGGNVFINSQVIQPDIFSNEEAIYRLRIDPLVGTKINAIVATGIDEFLVLKDRGCISGRIVVVNDTPDLIQQVISHDVGCSCVNSYAKDDAGVLYFSGYDDVYAYQNGQLQTLVERDDKNDWLYTYRSTLTRTQKESTTIFYLPELKSLMFLFGVDKAGSNYAQLQYLFHRGLWSEVMLKDATFDGTPDLSMRWVCQLKNGHVLVTSTETTPGFYRMSWATSNGGTTYALTYTDNGTGIAPYFDTGDLLMGDESTDVVLNKFVVNRTFTGQTLAGSLDLSVYNEDGTGYLKTGISTSDTRITARFAPTVVRKGQSWRAIFNKATSGRERITAGQYQINSLEFFGKKLPRVRSTGK